jgi:hypothetical protein
VLLPSALTVRIEQLAQRLDEGGLVRLALLKRRDQRVQLCNALVVPGSSKAGAARSIASCIAASAAAGSAAPSDLAPPVSRPALPLSCVIRSSNFFAGQMTPAIATLRSCRQDRS